MCCQDDEVLDLPAEAIEAIAHYRRLRSERGADWGDTQVWFSRWAGFPLLGKVAATDAAGLVEAVRATASTSLPAGVVFVHVDADARTTVTAGPPVPVLAGNDTTAPVHIVVDPQADTTVTINGEPHVIHSGQGDRILVEAGPELVVEGHSVTVTQVRRAAGLRLTSDDCARWSVTDEGGTAWFPPGVVHKWDYHGRPFFHSHDVVVPVPAGTLTVTCGRGLEFDTVVHNVVVEADATETVHAEPTRLFDPAAEGWYGGDLHVHLNYSGDQVMEPADAARMQQGEGLHLMNLVAGNFTDSLIYDRALFEQTAGADLPWSTPAGQRHSTPDDGSAPPDLAHDHPTKSSAAQAQPAQSNAAHGHSAHGHATQPSAAHSQPTQSNAAHHHRVPLVARMGVEYRNDLLGHVHALGPTRPPRQYQAGHERSSHPDDWPPNAVACADLRDAGATVGYCHPAGSEFPDDWSTDRFFASPRSVEARELIADAALGLVDSVDVISPFDHEGSAFLYHRLLSCGLRLAATAGTDVFLSFSRLPLASNPPGWGRVYAGLAGKGLSVEHFQDAVRAGRTMVTNGPWLMLDVDGHRPGSVLDRADGTRVSVTVTTAGPGVERIAIVGPDGVTLEKTGERELRAELTLDGPTWIAATAKGGAHPSTLDYGVFAHTSPVYVDVAGERVARLADARWCLDLLDRLQAFVAEHGHFRPETRAERFADLVAVLDEARTFYRAALRRATR